MGKKKDPGAGLRAQAQANMAEARKMLEAVDMPDYQKQQAYINLMAEQVPEIAGILQAEQMDTPEDIQEDPRLAGLKMQALESLSERGKAGLSEEDQLKYEDARMAMAADAASQQSDIERRMAERGAGGSGQELAMRLAGQQGQAQRASELGRGMAADALQAKMQSEQAAGSMAGQMSAQDMARQQQNEAAKRQIAQFNAANRMATQQQNLAARQNIANQRAGLQQQKYGQLGGLEQQKFSNQMSKAGGIAGAYTGTANMLNQQSAMVKPQRGLGGVIGTLAGAGIGAMTGTGPQGAQVGAQLGGAVGSQFADGGVVKAANGLSELETRPMIDPNNPQYGRRNAGRTIGGDLNVFKSQMKGLLSGEGLPTKKDPFGFEGQIAAAKRKGLDGSGLMANQRQDIIPDARDTGANMPAGESPAQKTQEAAAKGASKEGSLGLDVAKAVAGALPQEKEQAGLAYSNVQAPQVNLVQDQVFGRPFADGGIPGYIAEDGATISVDGGFIFPGEEDEYAGDRVDAKVNKGEMILNAEQQQRLLDLLRGEATPEDLVQLQNPEEDIVEEPEEAVGLMKVLEMIGRK